MASYSKASTWGAGSGSTTQMNADIAVLKRPVSILVAGKKLETKGRSAGRTTS